MTRPRSILLALCLLLAGAAVGVGGAPAGAVECGGYSGLVCDGPNFTIDDTTVMAGQTVGIAGVGCLPGDTVTFTIGDVTVGTAVADADGDYLGTITIPDLAPGTYTVEARCGDAVQGLEIVVGATPRGSTGATSGQPLARTGTDLGPLTALGAAALVLGGAAVYGTRRRRN